MKLLILALLATALLFTTADGQKVCRSVPGSRNCLLQSREIISKNKTKCVDNMDKCCWKNGKCYSKWVQQNTTDKSENSGEAVFKKPGPSERRFGIGGLSPCAVKEFPHTCEITGNEHYVLEPPVNIPYCVRIPCSLDRGDQAEYELSQLKCGSQPGCYFDVALAEYRAEFGDSVLAGVPVCHLAIRNAVFLYKARTVVKEYRKWNPYFTQCTLDTYQTEIEQEQQGCLLIPLLKAFGIYPKLASWKGQTKWGCVLNNGCWLKNLGCHYPVRLDHVFVKSGQEFVHNKFEFPHGRPKCQHFDSTNPYTTLKSIHICLSSGCSLDLNIAATYYQNLFEIGKHMDTDDHWEFWNLVEKGKIGSFNVETGIYWPYDQTFSGKAPTPNKSPTTSGGGAFNTVFGPPPSGPFVPPNLSLPPVPVHTAGSSSGCGPIFRKFDKTVRPCPPPKPDVYPINNFCPYQLIQLSRYKTLTGSIDGCCDINPCYLSRADIREMYSGPTHYFTEWTPWEKCTKSCGGGVTKRHRTCISQRPEKCDGEPESQTRKCALKICPSWSNWGPWSPCRDRCQLVSRRRTCNFGKCHGDPEQTKFCRCNRK